MPKKQTTFSSEVLVTLQRGSGQPLSLQLSNTLRTSIRSGILKAGFCLPASRSLAHDLGVSRSVIVEAYEQLIAEGYIISTPRSGTRVATTTLQNLSMPITHAIREQFFYDFRPGLPDTTLFPRSAWGAAMRQVLQQVPHTMLSYGDARGAEEARVELAGYLQRARGAVVRADRLILTTGFAQGLGLLCRILQARGIKRLAVEDPTHPEQRALISHFGLDLVSIPVDEEGLQVDELKKLRAQAVLVTPAHQFPLGVVLSPARRRALLQWANRYEGIIIEDDYDAEYRYDRAPIGALQGADPERVIYAGSVSKTLAPALRIGWLIAPACLIDALTEAKHYADLESPVLDQLTFSQMLSSGNIDRHLRRARQIYHSRRDVFVASVNEHIPGASIQGIAAGLHAVVTLPERLREDELVQRARDQKIGIYGLQSFYSQKTVSPTSLVMGYAALSEETIKRGIEQLAQIIKEMPYSS